MKNLRLKYKFIIIILLAALPATIATHLLVKTANQSIEFSSKEVAGRDYLQPLSRVYKLASEHRVSYMSSMQDKDTALARTRPALVKAMQKVDELNAQHATALKLGNAWAQARAGFEALMSTDLGLSYEQAMQAHNAAIENLNTLVQLVGDHSNLILDPDLDSFYLMDAVLLKIKPALSSLSNYQVVLSEQSGFMYQTSNLYTLKKVEGLISLVTETVNIAISHNPGLANYLDSANTQFLDDSTTALAALERVRVNSTPELQKLAFDSASTALESGYLLFDDVNAQLDRLLKIRIANAEQTRNNMVTFVIAAIICVMLFAYFVGRSITSTVVRAKTVAEAIASDRLDNDITSSGKDEPAQLMAALSVMQQKLSDRINRDRQESIINGRIKQALECVSSSVLVADVDRQIIYINRAAEDFFRKYETALAKDISGFSHKNIIGQSMNFMCSGTSLEASHGQLANANSFDDVVGGRHIRFIPSPVHDDDGEALGTVMEIRDRSDEVAVEQAVNTDVLGLVEDALAGNLSGQISSQGKPDFLVPVYTGINDMVGVCNNVISSAGQIFKRLADGDLSHSWNQGNSHELKGDFSRLRDDANTTIVQLSDMISKLKADSGIVNDSAGKVIGVNTQLEDNSVAASQQADTVSKAVHFISDNVDTIAGAAEQMNASIKEILKNTQRSNSVANQAVDLTKAADERVTQLSSSSLAIGAMVKVINSIAEQTNLLALNATIEAARAGDAGKGFAVVANEVKELAKETAKATEDISDKIHTIQNDSKVAAEGIREIDTIVQQISELQTHSATAMEEQSTTTQEISRSIGTVANSTSEILVEVSELVKGTSETTEAVHVAKTEVMQLNSVAGNLQKLVDNFELGDQPHSPSTISKAA